MNEKDEAIIANEKHWDRMVKEGCGYTIPWLNLDPLILQQYAKGKLETIPEYLDWIAPPDILADVAGKDVLCLAAGGGQQSAVFGLLGARVAVVDLSNGQLAGDRKAAEHYGYEVKTIQSDMQHLSRLDDESFDLVYGTAICYVPDARQVYSEIARVLRQDGIFRVDFAQPTVHFMAWNGKNYVVAQPYSQRIDRREDGAMEFRHYMDDIFNGIIEAGMSIRQVVDISRNVKPDSQAEPGSWNHEYSYIGGSFVIIAKKSM